MRRTHDTRLKKQCAADFGGDAFVRGHLRDRKLPEAAGRGCVRCHFAALGLLHALGGQCARGRHSAHGPRGRARRTDARDALVGHLSRRDSGALQGSDDLLSRRLRAGAASH